MKFRYQARSKSGEAKNGTVEASSEDAALQVLGSYDLFVTVLESVEAAPLYQREIRFFTGISKKNLMLFARELAIMFKAEVPLVEALRTLALQMGNKSFKEKVFYIAEDVEGGSSLSGALVKHPKLFSAFFVSMVKSGEASGKLTDVLDYMAEHLEREYTLQGKIKGAVAYPLLVLVLTIGVLFLMFYFILPQLIEVLQGLGQELPPLTRVIIALSLFTRAWGIYLIGGLIASAVGFVWYIQQPAGKSIFDTAMLRVPVLGNFLRMVAISRFAENLSTLISSGIPIVQALDITRDIVGNDVYRHIIRQASEGVERGERISNVLKNYPVEFPIIFTQMVAVGEQAGSLDTTLKRMVDFYQKEVDRTVGTVIALLEPILIIAMAVVVGLLLAGVLLPIYQASSL
jgi:type IV pilus assembly protein PilC